MRGPFAATWRNEPILEVQHEALKAEVQSIRFSYTYQALVRVAHHWGITPMQFSELTHDDQVTMVAGYEIEQRIGLLQNYEQKKLAEARRKHKNRKAPRYRR